MSLEGSLLYVDDQRINAYYEQMYLALEAQSSVATFFKLWPAQVHHLIDTTKLEPAPPFASSYEKMSRVTQHIRKSNQHHLLLLVDFAWRQSVALCFIMVPAL